MVEGQLHPGDFRQWPKASPIHWWRQGESTLKVLFIESESDNLLDIFSSNAEFLITPQVTKSPKVHWSCVLLKLRKTRRRRIGWGCGDFYHYYCPHNVYRCFMIICYHFYHYSYQRLIDSWMHGQATWLLSVYCQPVSFSIYIPY